MAEHLIPGGCADNTATGWLGRLQLEFERRDNRTVMSRCQHSGPLTVQRAFYPEADYPHIYLLHPPGGVVGGDRLELAVTLGPDSHALLTMPGATKFYRSGGQLAQLTQHFHLAEGSTLEWLPQGNIFFPACQVAIKSEFTLCAGARLLGFETLCLGRPANAERFHSGTLNSLLRINLPDSPGLFERLRIADGQLANLGEWPITATFFASPANDELLNQVRQWLDASGSPAAGATLLDHLLLVRLLDDDNQRLQRILHQLWILLRPAMVGREAVLPRIWAT